MKIYSVQELPQSVATNLNDDDIVWDNVPEIFILRPRHRVGLNNLYTGFPFVASVAFIVTANQRPR